MPFQEMQLDPDIIEVIKSTVKLNEFQNPDGSVEFNKQQVLQLAGENRTSEPDTPNDGQIWLRTDL